MKRLSIKQLGDLGIHNPYEFCRGSFYLDFTPYSRQTIGSFGWNLSVPNKPNPDPERWGQTSYQKWSFRLSLNGKSTPSEMRLHLEPELVRLGFSWPDEWIRFMGGWVSKSFFEERMAHLIKRFEERQFAQGGLR